MKFYWLSDATFYDCINIFFKPFYVFEEHYENTPIQIYRKFHLKKNEIFQIKNSHIFFVFLLKT